MHELGKVARTLGKVARTLGSAASWMLSVRICTWVHTEREHRQPCAHLYYAASVYWVLEPIIEREHRKPCVHMYYAASIHLLHDQILNNRSIKKWKKNTLEKCPPTKLFLQYIRKAPAVTKCFEERKISEIFIFDRLLYIHMTLFAKIIRSCCSFLKVRFRRPTVPTLHTKAKQKKSTKKQNLPWGSAPAATQWFIATDSNGIIPDK